MIAEDSVALPLLDRPPKYLRLPFPPFRLTPDVRIDLIRYSLLPRVLQKLDRKRRTGLRTYCAGIKAVTVGVFPDVAAASSRSLSYRKWKESYE
jgi:hypothetical protein